MITQAMKYAESFVFQFWWVLFFLLFCYMCYEQGVRHRNRDFNRLNKHYENLQMEKQLALEEQKDLLLQINSQSDPAWVEVVLMKELGVVPEGQQKVFFKN